MRVGLLVGPLTTIPRRQSEYPFCNGTRDKPAATSLAQCASRTTRVATNPAPMPQTTFALPYGNSAEAASAGGLIHVSL